MSSKGMTISCSMIENDGQYEVGFSYKDSDDIEFDETYEGDDLEDILEDLANDAVASLIEQRLGMPQEEEEKSEEEAEKDEYTLQLEKIIEDLTAENNSLKTDVKILQRRADDAVNKIMNNSKVRVSNLDKLLRQADPFEKLLKFYFQKKVRGAVEIDGPRIFIC